MLIFLVWWWKVIIPKCYSCIRNVFGLTFVLYISVRNAYVAIMFNKLSFWSPRQMFTFTLCFYIAQIVLTGRHVDKIEIWWEKTWSQASCLPAHARTHSYLRLWAGLFIRSEPYIFFLQCVLGFLCHSQCAKRFCLPWNNNLCTVGHLFFIYLFSLQWANVLLEEHTLTLFAVQNFVLFAVHTFLLFAARTFFFAVHVFVHRSPKVYFVYSVRDISFLLSVKYFVCNEIFYLQHFLWNWML